MRIALLGAPGSGKDTQAKQVAQKHGIPVIVTAELVREVITADTPLGQQAKAATETGTLPDDILFPIIRERLSRDDTNNGFLFSGFPRTAAQAESLDNLLNELGQPLQAALLIQVDPEMLIERLTGRRTCISCGAAFNIYTSPSRLGDICDKCGGNLRHRADDNEETITNRIRAFEAQTKPLVEYYRQQGRIRVVQGMGEIRDIAKAIDKVIRNLPEIPVTPVVEEVTAESKSEVTLTDLANKVAEAAKMAREDDTKTVGGEAAATAAAPKKAAPKKAAPKKAAPKKAAPKKAAPKKAAPKKAAPKKAAPKKAAPKKAAPKKAAPKKAAPKKAAPKKAAPKKAAPKKAAPKKAAPKKAAPKKAAPKKAAPKKAAPKKAAPKKAAPKKAAPKKAAPKKAAPKKAAPKKAAPKKAAPKRAAPKRR
jgi:adenylate kinase